MPFRTYSSGMQLRLAFSTSTAIRPEILVMDEWLSTGDEDFKHKADKRLREIVDTTKILVLASHSRELLQNNCNRILWMEHGRVRMDGPTDRGPAGILRLRPETSTAVACRPRGTWCSNFVVSLKGRCPLLRGPTLTNLIASPRARGNGTKGR